MRTSKILFQYVDIVKKTNPPSQRGKPLPTNQMPFRLFQTVTADSFEYDGQPYLLVIDFFSRYLEIAHLPRITSGVLTYKMKNIFAHYGIKEMIVTDNGR